MEEDNSKYLFLLCQPTIFQRLKSSLFFLFYKTCDEDVQHHYHHNNISSNTQDMEMKYEDL